MTESIECVQFDISKLQAVSVCFVASGLFVGSLYIWPSSRRVSRDEPKQIQRRFLSVFLACIVITFLVWNFAIPSECTYSHEKLDGIENIPRNTLSLPFRIWLGLWIDNSLLFWFGSLMAVVVLYTGPIMQSLWALLNASKSLSDAFTMLYYQAYSILRSLSDRNTFWVYLRNFVVGPVVEEWAFRANVIPLLWAAGFGFWSIVILAPLAFGLAHIHHVYQHVHIEGYSKKQAWVASLGQLGYTSIFGSFSSFLFLRVGSIIPPIQVHCFCNVMGFPNIEEVFLGSKSIPKDKNYGILSRFLNEQFVLRFLYVLGVFGFFVLIAPLTVVPSGRPYY